jgi:type VI secretion system secreted protein VgrG
MALLARDTKVTCPLPEGMLLLETLHGSEALGVSYSYSLTLLSENPRIQATDLLGQPMTVHVRLDSGEERYFGGIVSYFAKTGLSVRHTRYQAAITSRLALFEHTRDCRILFDGTAPSLVTDVLAKRGFTDVESGSLQGGYRNREYTVQYRESDFDFVHRLLEEEGIYYFFKHDQAKQTMVLADSVCAHSQVSGYESVKLVPKERRGVGAEEHFWSLNVAGALHAGKYTTLVNYDYVEPRAWRTQTEDQSSPFFQPGRAFDDYDNHGSLLERAHAEADATVRLEHDVVASTMIEVEGNTMGLGVGDLVSLERSPLQLEYAPFWNEADFDKEYLITSATYTISINQYESGDVAPSDEPFRASFTLLDSHIPFRPRRRTPRPRIKGPQTALVVGPAGEEIYTDELGRVKVEFDWDRIGQRDQKSSCWVRAAQTWAGKQWGALHTPRIGQEVIVEFLDGDPDRPIINGRVYNADNMPPYALPDNKTQSGTKSRSSKDGSASNYNEIRFEDLKGSEHFHVQAEKDMSIVVENDETREVGHDRKKHVKNDEGSYIDRNRTEEVGEDEKITIHGNRAEIVDKDEKITIHGNRAETVDKDETVTIHGNRNEKVDKDQSTTIIGARTTTIDKAASLKVSGSRTVYVTKADSLHVKDARKQEVSKDDDLEVGHNLFANAGDETTLKTGSSSLTLKKDGTITLKGKELTVTGVGTIALEATATLTFKGSQVTMGPGSGEKDSGGVGAPTNAQGAPAPAAAGAPGSGGAGASGAGPNGGGPGGSGPSVHRWPVLAVHEVHFDSIPVVKDGTAEINKEFPRRWTRGTASQSPICYASESALAVSVTFDVTTTSTYDEDVRVKGVWTIGETNFTWKGTVKVKAGAKTATLASVRSAAALPPGVAIHEPMSIAWSMVQSDGATWLAIGKTQQTLYVTLKAPAGVKAYWTLLDLSCRAAAGKTSEDGFVPAAFSPFRASVGDGKGIQRKGDGVRLSYYLNGVDTSADQNEPSVYTARGILSRPDGTGRCGGWANLLIHLFKIHGVTSAKKLWFVRDDAASPDMSKRFLVKNCDFVGSGTSRDDPGYPYKGKVECVKQDGIPGQGKTNPQFDFGDHVVVEHGGKIYDPSYGSGPTVGQRAYEDAGIAGVGEITNGITFNHGGTPQFISEICGKGYIHHKLVSGETLATVAANFGAPSADALLNHRYNRDLKFMRVTPDNVVAGDSVRIPREMTTKPILASRYV